MNTIAETVSEIHETLKPLAEDNTVVSDFLYNFTDFDSRSTLVMGMFDICHTIVAKYDESDIPSAWGFHLGIAMQDEDDMSVFAMDIENASLEALIEAGNAINAQLTLFESVHGE